MTKILFLRSVLILFTSMLFITTNLIAEDSSDTSIKIISAKEANALIEENSGSPEFVILDVRTSEEYNSGHIESAVNIEYKSNDFKQNIEKLDRDKVYITYCRSGRRSTGASELMKGIGFENIYIIEGGIVAWDKAQLPTVKYPKKAY